VRSSVDQKSIQGGAHLGGLLYQLPEAPFTVAWKGTKAIHIAPKSVSNEPKSIVIALHVLLARKVQSRVRTVKGEPARSRGQRSD
jgi:hypothetical protein